MDGRCRWRSVAFTEWKVGEVLWKWVLDKSGVVHYYFIDQIGKNLFVA